MCLLVNLSFGGGWEVTERRGGVGEVWRRGRGGARIPERADHVWGLIMKQAQLQAGRQGNLTLPILDNWDHVGYQLFQGSPERGGALNEG